MREWPDASSRTFDSTAVSLRDTGKGRVGGRGGVRERARERDVETHTYTQRDTQTYAYTNIHMCTHTLKGSSEN